MKCPFVIKICSKCKRLLVANKINFNKDKTGKYGVKSYCKKCEKQYKKEYNEQYKDKRKEYDKERYKRKKEDFKKYNKQYREENKEYCKEYRKQYYEEHKEKLKEDAKEYYENNKENILKRNKQYYENHKEKLFEKYKKYREENPYINFNSQGKRRSREENQGNGITKEQWFEMMEFFDWRCAYSGIQLNKNNRTIDHITPLSKDGEHEIWNCVPCYDSYNFSKHAKNMEEWYMQQEFFDIDRLLKIYEWIEYAWNKWKILKVQERIENK